MQASLSYSTMFPALGQVHRIWFLIFFPIFTLCWEKHPLFDKVFSLPKISFFFFFLCRSWVIHMNFQVMKYFFYEETRHTP